MIFRVTSFSFRVCFFLNDLSCPTRRKKTEENDEKIRFFDRSCLFFLFLNFFKRKM